MHAHLNRRFRPVHYAAMSRRALASRNGRNGRNDTARAVLSSDLRGQAPAEIEIMPAGRIETRPNDSRDSFVNRDPEAVVAATRELRLDLPVDYDHQIEYSRENGRPAPAAGWIKNLFVRAGAIWGKVEWTERARAHIEAREYRFLSPVFVHGVTERDVRRIDSVALTNNPAFFMRALAAAGFENPNNQETDLMKKEDLIKALGLKADATDAQVEEALTAAAKAAKVASAAIAGLKAVAKAVGLDESATAEAIAEAAKTATAALGQVATAAGLETDAKSADIVTAVAAAKAEAKPKPLSEAEITKRVEARISARAEMTALASGGFLTPAVATGFEPLIEAMPVEAAAAAGELGKALAGSEARYANLGKRTVPGRKPTGSGPDTLTDSEKAICRATGVSEEDYVKSVKALAEAEEEG